MSAFKCSYCGQTTERIDPESGDLWACWDCQERWAKQEKEAPKEPSNGR